MSSPFVSDTRLARAIDRRWTTNANANAKPRRLAPSVPSRCVARVDRSSFPGSRYIFIAHAWWTRAASVTLEAIKPSAICGRDLLDKRTQNGDRPATRGRARVDGRRAAGEARARRDGRRMARAIVGDALAALALARRCAVSTRRSPRRGTGAAGETSGVATTRGRAVRSSAEGGDGGEVEGEESSVDADAVASTSAPRTYRPGAFSRLPNVSPAEQLITSAVKRAGRVTASKGLKDAARERNKSAKQLDALTSGLCKPLKEYVKGFPAPERLHPFERALLELTLSDKKYRTTLESVDLIRKGMLGIGKGYASQVTKTTALKDATELREKGFAEMEAYYRKYARCVDDLKSIAKLLRRLPVAELETPTVALVGAPNVGKSSLVRVLSSGMPEVCNYPFTTKGIKMGHFFIDEERHVVTDTPGLINRAEIDRNKIEMLTIATLEHLPTCVVFVTDLSGLSGTSIEDQLELREEIYAQFGDRRPWIDVFSKSALVPVLGGETDADTQEIWNDDDIARARSAMEKIPNAAVTSADEGWGIDELKERMIKILRDHKSSLPAADGDYSTQGENRNKSDGDDLPAYIPML